jgi:hypothetical protein
MILTERLIAMTDIKFEDVALCECCAIVAANGDDSGCRDFHMHPDHTLSKIETHVIVEGTSQGNETFTCDGCGWHIECGMMYAGAEKS